MTAITGKSLHTFLKYSVLALPNTHNSATPNHQASKDVCSHLLSALKDETSFETVQHPLIMAAAKQSSELAKRACTNRSSSASQIQYQQQTKAPFSEAKNQASGCKSHRVKSMELASLKWNSEMHCIFDIAEHLPISPPIAIVVELNSPELECKK